MRKHQREREINRIEDAEQARPFGRASTNAKN